MAKHLSPALRINSLTKCDPSSSNVDGEFLKLACIDLALKLLESFQKNKILQCMKGMPNTLNSGKQNDQNENVHAQL
jgi:hypothetical protein